MKKAVEAVSRGMSMRQSAKTLGIPLTTLHNEPEKPITDLLIIACLNQFLLWHVLEDPLLRASYCTIQHV